MRALYLALLLLVAACGEKPGLVKLEIVPLDVPENLIGCPNVVAIPDPPPPPRTTDAVLEAYGKALAGGRKNGDNLKECRYRNRKLLEWIRANQVVPGNLKLPPLPADEQDVPNVPPPSVKPTRRDDGPPIS